MIKILTLKSQKIHTWTSQTNFLLQSEGLKLKQPKWLKLVNQISEHLKTSLFTFLSRLISQIGQKYIFGRTLNFFQIRCRLLPRPEKKNTHKSSRKKWPASLLAQNSTSLKFVSQLREKLIAFEFTKLVSMISVIFSAFIHRIQQTLNQRRKSKKTNFFIGHHSGVKGSLLFRLSIRK